MKPRLVQRRRSRSPSVLEAERAKEDRQSMKSFSFSAPSNLSFCRLCSGSGSYSVGEKGPLGPADGAAGIKMAGEQR